MPDPDNEAAARLDRARNKLANAQTLLDQDLFEETAHAAYYAMFHAAMGALVLHDSHPKTHRGTVAEFNRCLVQPGHVPARATALLQRTLDVRLKGDYGVEPGIEADEAQTAVASAREFVDLVAPILEG